MEIFKESFKKYCKDRNVEDSELNDPLQSALHKFSWANRNSLGVKLTPDETAVIYINLYMMMHG